MLLEKMSQALRRTWWVVILALLFGAIGGLVYSTIAPPVYVARATYVGSFETSSGEAETLESDLSKLAQLQALVGTYCQIMESRSAIEAASSALNLPQDVVAGYTPTCSALQDSYVLELQVLGPDPDLASELADAIGAASLAQVSELQEIYSLRELDAAAADTTPILPNRAQNVVSGAAAGLAVGVVAALWCQSRAEHKPLRLSESEAHGVPVLQNARILLVDDDVSHAKMHLRVLQGDGYRVEMVHDGESALRMAKEWKPDLVLLDVMLPGIDGFEVCRRLRGSKETANTSIILLTAKLGLTDKDEGFSAGADGYITKPVDPFEVSMRVAAQLRRVRTVA